jgi:hypothetical protein
MYQLLALSFKINSKIEVSSTVSNSYFLHELIARVHRHVSTNALSETAITINSVTVKNATIGKSISIKKV